MDRDGTGSRDNSDDDSVEPGDTVTRTLRRGDSGAQVRRFQRQLKDLRYWIGPVGRLWRPKYFHSDGIALHGFSSVPATPSSHGCVRVTVPAMNFIWANAIAPEGSTVWIYGRAP